MSKAKDDFYSIRVPIFDHDMELVENYVQELEKQKKELIKLIEYCCYEGNFDSDFLIAKLKEIKKNE